MAWQRHAVQWVSRRTRGSRACGRDRLRDHDGRDGAAPVARVAADLSGPRRGLRPACRSRHPGHHVRGRRSTSSRSVREPDRVESQATSSASHGLDGLVADGRAAWEAGAATGGLEAIRGRSRIERGRGTDRRERVGRLQRDRVEWTMKVDVRRADDAPTSSPRPRSGGVATIRTSRSRSRARYVHLAHERATGDAVDRDVGRRRAGRVRGHDHAVGVTPSRRPVHRSRPPGQGRRPGAVASSCSATRAARTTSASEDPRALPLYVRFGHAAAVAVVLPERRPSRVEVRRRWSRKKRTTPSSSRSTVSDRPRAARGARVLEVAVSTRGPIASAMARDRRVRLPRAAASMGRPGRVDARHARRAIAGADPATRSGCGRRSRRS